MPSDDHLLEKILARTTENGCTPAEAESALRAALRRLVQRPRTLDPGPSDYSECVVMQSKQVRAEHALAAAICQDFFLVRAFREWVEGEKRESRLVFFGIPADLRNAERVFRSILDSFRGLWERYREESMPGRKARIEYMTGIARGIVEKLDSDRVASGTTLVRLDEALQRAFERRHPEIDGEMPLREVANHDVVCHGKLSAREVQLN